MITDLLAGLREPIRDGEVPKDQRWWEPLTFLILMKQREEWYLDRDLTVRRANYRSSCLRWKDTTTANHRSAWYKPE